MSKERETFLLGAGKSEIAKPSSTVETKSPQFKMNNISNTNEIDVESGRSLIEKEKSSILKTFQPIYPKNQNSSLKSSSPSSSTTIAQPNDDYSSPSKQQLELQESSNEQQSLLSDNFKIQFPNVDNNKSDKQKNNGFTNLLPFKKWNGVQQSIDVNGKNDKNNNSGNNTAHKTNGNIQMELIWRQLTYNVSKFSFKSFIKKRGHGYEHRRLLNSVSGSMRAGELMAIMGPSGAGKTTLIECISGRRRTGVTGDIFVSGCTKRTKLAYMAQDDAFMPCLTVYETLLFASKLRNYQRNNTCKVKLIDDNENVYNATTYPDSNLVISLPNETYHRNLVEQIIKKLGLENCRNVKAEMCSGGQQKRLCIALELIHSPTILILDEPTSGLDSVSCLQCVTLLRDLAHNPEQPMAIAASIHQPTARILQNFDRLYVLANNGQCMYDGPTDQLVQHLAKFKLTCPTYHNPADFVLEVASGDYGQEVIKQLVSAQLTQHQTGCMTIKETSSNFDKKEETDDDDDESANMEELRLWPANKTDNISIQKICQRSRKQIKRRELYKTILLWLRCMLLAMRDPTEYLLRIFACVSIILLNVVLYKDSEVGKADGCSQDSMMHLINTIKSDYDGNQTFSLTNSLMEGPGALAILNFGFIFFAMMFVAFLAMMPVILTFPLEVAVFYKEYFNGWYSFSSYFLAKNLTNLLPSILLPILFGSTTFFITHQYWELWRFLYFIIILVMISLVADGVGVTISALFVHNVNAASIFAAISQIPLMLFTGLLVQIEQLPKVIQPLTYLSYYRLCFEACVIVFFGHERCKKPEPFDMKKIRTILGDDVEEVMDCVWQNTNFFESVDEKPSLSDRLEKILASTENQNPSLIMQNFRLKDEDLHFLMICLGIYAIVARIVAYIVLYRKANSRK